MIKNVNFVFKNINKGQRFCLFRSLTKYFVIFSNKSIVPRIDNKLFPDHYPVLHKPILNIIEEQLFKTPKDKMLPKVIGDFTIGCGNHSKAILEKFESTFIIGVDLDKKMIDHTKQKLFPFIKNNRLVLINDNYVCVSDIDISEEFSSLKLFSTNKAFDLLLLDLGFNSQQLLDQEKGLSFKFPKSELDMRYDTNNDDKAKASDILNHSSEMELIEIFRKFGEESFSEVLVKNIIQQRDIKRFIFVEDFLKVIDQTYLSKTRDRFNTYTRLFQALRICVNYELLNIQRFINKSMKSLEIGGIILIITFHSLEDKIVKDAFRQYEKLRIGKVLFKKALEPSEEELNENSRSRSAKLRGFIFNPY
jgi:16S rRNA (cytosine1402-N4)-methyltransferase